MSPYLSSNSLALLLLVAFNRGLYRVLLNISVADLMSLFSVVNIVIFLPLLSVTALRTVGKINFIILRSKCFQENFEFRYQRNLRRKLREKYFIGSFQLYQRPKDIQIPLSIN
eukprot:NODE_84_length_22354_cov_0.646506.p20 type:complete len:113 gc:universal NODE_84_length_22354_cov_0.646506:10028-10366(+)